ADDATIEALLEAQDSDPAYGQGMLARAHAPPVAESSNKHLAIAAILFLATIPFALIAIAHFSSGETNPITGNDPEGGESISSLIEITPDFPDPVFQGTPFDIKLPNLEPARSPRLTFTAPEGVHLISQGAKVTSSHLRPFIGRLEMVTDGQKAGDDAHFVELPPGHQWIQIELGEPHEIFAITLWHYHQKMRAYRDVVIEASSDPSFSAGTTIVYNSDHDDSLGLGAGEDKAYIETNHGRIIDVKAVTARYIRLHSNGNTEDELNHYTEVEVWGK
ncbi:MAG: hypothetical protein ACI9MB_002335, partial [Verrucomicrobiales bacterium]